MKRKMGQPTKGLAFKSGPGPCIGYIAGLLGCTWPNKDGTPWVPNGWNGTPKTDDAGGGGIADHVPTGDVPLRCKYKQSLPSWP